MSMPAKCPYHPNEDTHKVVKDGIEMYTCPECEWNPPEFPSDTGKTSPNIKSFTED